MANDSTCESCGVALQGSERRFGMCTTCVKDMLADSMAMEDALSRLRERREQQHDTTPRCKTCGHEIRKGEFGWEHSGDESWRDCSHRPEP